MPKQVAEMEGGTYACRFGLSAVVRVRGWGLYVGYKRPVHFSERYGYRRVYRIGPWAIEPLSPHTGKERKPPAPAVSPQEEK